MMTEQSNLKKLIQKVSSQLPQIQIRSLNTIYTKISHQIVTSEALLEYPQFAGVLMNWINENKKKSDILLKVIYLLSCYTKFDKGLILLRQYECLQFCEEFKIYLVQNERAVDSFTQELQLIIKSLSPLGRADESRMTSFNKQNDNNQNNTQNQLANKDQKIEIMFNKINKIQVKEVLKFKCQNLPISEAQDKTIFELLMKMKYANKQAAFATLTQIRRFVLQFTNHYFRCKSDLILHLCEISIANIFPQICLQIICSLMEGLITSQNSCNNSQLNYLINLTYAKIIEIPFIEVEISLPFKIFQIPESFIIVKQLIRLIQTENYAIYLPYLLSINYKYSPQFLFQILAKLKEKEIVDHANLYVGFIEEYAQKYLKKCDNFINILPESVWRKVKVLISIHDNSQKKCSYKHIEQYMNPKQFEITKNLHMMRQVINNLKKGIIGIEVSPKEAVRLYLDVLLTLTISVSRQDPLMSYFSEAQQLFLSILSHGSKNVAAIAYQELFEGIKNTKLTVNYPGMIVHRHQIIEIIFTSPQFAKKIIQCSLELNETLATMLNIVLFFISKDKFRIFSPFVSIFCVLCNHPNELANMLSNQILSKMAKNYSIISTICNLYSTTTQTRKNSISQLLDIKQQSQINTIDQIMTNQSTSKNKQLKISAQSIQNYLNIVLNPGLDLNIKDSAINQFIQCIERADGSHLPDLIQAQIILVEEIKKYVKKQQMTVFEEKIIVLHLTLGKKKSSMVSTLTLEILINILQKVKSQLCRSSLLITIYAKVFQSPFTKQLYTQSWVMMHFPHLQLIKMNIQQPIRSNINNCIQKTQTVENIPLSKNTKSNDKFGELYISLIELACKSGEISEQIIETIQEEIVSAVTTNNIVKISKLAFLFSNCQTIKIYKPTFKIILQFIRVNTSALDIADQLVQIIKNSEQVHEFVGSFNNLSFFLLSLTNKSIGNEQLQKMLKLVDDSIGIDRIFYTLATEPAVKFSIFSQYNSLKLIQSIISTIRNNRSDMQNRSLALILLNRLINQQFRMQDHNATILTLMSCLLFETKLTVFQFSIIVPICSSLAINKQTGEMSNYKLIKSIVEQICTLIYNSTQQLYNKIIIATCFHFLNYFIKYQCIHKIQQNLIEELIYNQPNNMLILAVSLIPKNIADCDHSNSHMIRQIYTFLFLFSANKNQSLFILLNSTDILLISLNIIAPLSSSTKLTNDSKVAVFDAIGRLIHQLSTNTDQFIFKLNKVVRGLGQNSQYLLHYTLMCPIPLINKYYSVKQQQHRLDDFSYIKMVCWICYIWKQETKILEDIDVIEQIVSCILQIKQLHLITPFLFKSSTAQKLIRNSSYISERFKIWIKSVQEVILEKNKNKKGKHCSQDLEYHKKNVEEGLTFAAAMFSPIENRIQTEETNIQKQTILSCVRFVDQIYHLLEIQQMASLQELWRKVLINLFRNCTCSKTISTVINENSFETIIKLITKIQNSITNLTDVSSQLELLGFLSCNQSNYINIIKQFNFKYIGKYLVDENKLAKINYGIVYCTASFLLYLSCFKETNAKIQGDKRLMDIWAKTLSLQQSEVVEQKILQLLINLATYKHSKATFMTSKQIHKVSMGLLSNPEYVHKQMILMMLYNILYKNAAGIKMYKKNQVCELFNKLSSVEELHQMAETLLQVINSQD